MNKNIINKKNLPYWQINDSEIKTIDDIPKTNLKPYGFVYKITYDDKSFYIGKKILYHKKDVRLSSVKNKTLSFNSIFKKRIKGKGLIEYVTIQVESNWLSYVGSNKTEPINITKREILEIAFDSLHLTFLENKYLYNLILDDKCRNKSISNSIYRDRLRQSLGLNKSEY